MKSLTRRMLPGIWLILALPLTALLFWLAGTALDMGSRWEVQVFITSFLIGHLATGYLWARGLLHLSGRPANPLAGIAAGLGFGATVVGIRSDVGFFERFFEVFINLLGVGGDEHLEFAVIFIIWTAIVTGGTGLAFGFGLRDWKLAVRLLGTGLLVGAGIFTLATVLFTWAGFRVGTPRPDGLPSMVIITVTGIWLAALVGSGVFGRILQHGHSENPEEPIRIEPVQAAPGEPA